MASAKAATCSIYTNMDQLNLDSDTLEIMQSDFQRKGYKFVEFQGDANMILKTASAFCHIGYGSPAGGGCEVARAYVNLIAVDDADKNLEIAEEDSGIIFDGSRKSALRKVMHQVPYCQ